MNWSYNILLVLVMPLYQLAMALVALGFAMLACCQSLILSSGKFQHLRATRDQCLAKLGMNNGKIAAPPYTLWLHGCSAGEIALLDQLLPLSFPRRKHSRPNILLTYQSRSVHIRAAQLKNWLEKLLLRI